MQNYIGCKTFCWSVSASVCCKDRCWLHTRCAGTALRISKLCALLAERERNGARSKGRCAFAQRLIAWCLPCASCAGTKSPAPSARASMNGYSRHMYFNQDEWLDEQSAEVPTCRPGPIDSLLVNASGSKRRSSLLPKDNAGARAALFQAPSCGSSGSQHRAVTAAFEGQLHPHV